MAELEAMIEQAREARDGSTKHVLCQRLSAFVADLPRGTEEQRATYAELSRIATELGLSLLLNSIEACTEGIASRTVELEALRARLER